MKNRVFTWIIILIALSLTGACAPKSRPVGTAPPTPVAIAPAKTATPTSNISPVRQAQGEPPASQDPAWARVVEAAKKEGLLTIYSATAFAGDGGRRSVEAFSKEYGIRVELLIAAGRQVVERVKVESTMKQPIGDIVSPGLSSATELSLAGLLDSIWQDLPELRNMAVFKVDPKYTPNGDVLNMVFAVAGVLVNTKLVKAQDEPRSYFDLLDPKWKGKMILTDPRAGAGGGFAWFAEMRYYKVLDDDYFRRFARQEPILWGGGSVEETGMVARGEAWLNLYKSYKSAGDIILEGAPLKLLGMTEGNSLLTEPIAMVKGTAHPNAAKLFINWLLSREGQEILARETVADSVRKDVPNFVDPRVRPQPEPQRLLPRTYEVAETMNRYHKEGIAESLFGKR